MDRGGRAPNFKPGSPKRHLTQPCLSCGKGLDTAQGIGHGHKPRPGYITMCLHCGHLMAFGEGLRFRELTDAEMVEVAGDERILAIQKARATVILSKVHTAQDPTSVGAETAYLKYKDIPDTAPLVFAYELQGFVKFLVERGRSLRFVRERTMELFDLLEDAQGGPGDGRRRKDSNQART